MTTERLCVCITVDEPRVPRWLADVIDTLEADERFLLEVRIAREGAPMPRARRRPRPGIGFRLADALDRVVSRKVWHAAFLREGYDGDARVAIEPSRPCRQARTVPDVVLVAGFDDRAVADGRPRFGTWLLEIDGIVVPDAGPTGYGAVASDDPLTRIALLATGGDAGADRVPVATAICKTFRASWNENRRRIEARTTTLVVDALVALASERKLPTCTPEPRLARRPRPIYPFVLARCFARLAARIYEKLAFEERWQLALFDFASVPVPGHAPEPRFVTGPFRADPCLERDGDDVYVFHETMGGTPEKGEISVLRLREGEIEDLGVAIAQPYHMSFPMVFRADGARWMVPESSAAGRIELWRADAFPLGWVKVCDLMTGVSASDTVLWRGEDRWWMFTNIDRRAAPDHCHELHLFWADDFRSGTWHPHPMNPVVRDVSRARMAGRIFRDESGRLVRCAQDNRYYYGDALRFMAIDALTPEEYREHEIDAIDLDWVPGANGQHHIDRLGPLVATDVRFRWPRWRPLAPVLGDGRVFTRWVRRAAGLRPSRCGRPIATSRAARSV